MNKREEESFHVKCVPGRALMVRRTPTKRIFTFHLSKFESQNKEKENLLSTKRSGSCRKRLVEQSEGSIFSERSQKRFCSLKKHEIDKNIYLSEVKQHKINVRNESISKNVSDVLRAPLSMLKSCENFETPFLTLLPLASLQRRLFDKCGSFTSKKSLGTSQISSHLDSSSAIPNLIFSNSSNSEFNCSTHSNSKEESVLELSSKNGSQSNKMQIDVVEKNLDKMNQSLINLPSINDNNFITSKEAKTVADIINCQSYVSNINHTVGDFSDDCNDKETKSENSDFTEKSIEEKILNTPLYNNLGKLKQNKTKCKHNIEAMADKHISEENPNIMLISSLNIENDMLFEKSIKECSQRNFHISTKNEKLDNNKKELEINCFSNSIATGMQNFTINNKSSLLNTSQILLENSKAHHLLQNSASLFKNTSKVSTFTCQIIPNAVYKSKESKKLKPRFPSVKLCASKEKLMELPEKVNAFMWKKSLLNRKNCDVTDLEIICLIFAQNLFDMRDQVTDVNLYQKLKFYEKAIINDISKLISQTVELQQKHKEINKLCRKLNRKGKYLGVLVDERHKLCHKIHMGELHIKT